MLLTVLIAMVMLVIGNSVARAFGLVGALSIVRFRTVVSDTRDTAFVIFAVVIGMALGAGSVVVVLAGIPVVGVLVILLDRVLPGPSDPGGRYTLLVAGRRRIRPRVAHSRCVFTRRRTDPCHRCLRDRAARDRTRRDVRGRVGRSHVAGRPPRARGGVVACRGVLAVECQQRAAGE